MRSFSDELYHYGILGMKWGVRRTPEELGHKRISKSDYKKGYYSRSDSEKITIPKGTKLYRMSYKQSDSDSSGIYVTRAQMDRDFYKRWYSGTQMARGKKAADSLYEQTYVANEELKIPSFDERREAMKEVIKDSKIRKEIGEDMTAKFLRSKGGLPISHGKDLEPYKQASKKYDMPGFKGLIKAGKDRANNILKEIDAKDTPVRYRDDSMARVISESDSARRAYIENLKKKGYNATVDDFGRKGVWGPKGETSEALIIFNKSSMDQKASKIVSPFSSEALATAVKLNDLKYNAKVFKDKDAKTILVARGVGQAGTILASIGGVSSSIITAQPAFAMGGAVASSMILAAANDTIERAEKRIKDRSD